MMSNRGDGGPGELVEWINLSFTPTVLIPPSLSKIKEEGTSSSPVHELAQVGAQEVQETPLPTLRLKPKTSDIANTCHILSVKNGLFFKEF